MTPRVCVEALWTEFVAHLEQCAQCQARQGAVLMANPMIDECPEGWALLKAWGDAGKRERAESVASEMQDCAEGL